MRHIFSVKDVDQGDNSPLSVSTGTDPISNQQRRKIILSSRSVINVIAQATEQQETSS